MWYIGIIFYAIGLYAAGTVSWKAFLCAVLASFGALLFANGQ